MKTIITMLVCVTIFFSSVPRAEAMVGIAISSRSAKSVGGIMSLGGAGGVATGIGLSAIFGNSYAFLALSVLGATAGIIGIVILDEKSAELKFSPLETDKAQIIGVSSQMLEVFNNEVEELNLLNSEIESRISKKTSDQEVIEHWKVAQQYLSPETLKVAARIIATSVEAKK